MKAQDLMIGDWVEVNNTALQIAALGTAKAGFLDEKGEMFYHYYDNIAPIPLTAEMLQANCFEFISVDKTTNFPNGARIYAYENREETVYVSENGVIWWLEIEFADYADNIRMAVDYVHQLQHALRLCGIEKDIKL